ncbi:MAG: polyprenyl synthetase family protein [Alphaproteobacteria bacterium]|jgi:farnesyl diphosphate synthase|nr:polyprenyl synthetase family protein [Alphaproteobacteria bacterium]MDP7055900.1 polyprenyl synthetase family protein [Alphaproteobacteria bacterium]MDP7461211.1 polyprenyl synthetase family protein [Alphaproteobacteria bacterium]MEE1556635.1 farnesyl diphosphate synthase [Alphaproteobacteria bacterium]HJM92061.1 farnesyl diphosphate synthase [Alphaproteobacteria bacterium]|tara:strand:+ start:2897 stop:3784 length:888 start_codon:yes stop_codon:yes gene_type:complete
MVDFNAMLDKAAEAVDQELANLLPEGRELEHRLFDAMRHAVLGGGKRLRPFLVIASGEIFDMEMEQCLRTAAAVELVHAYSLVHDDLPCMDDDDLRRGRPTVHKKFDEATAVLTGDALLTLAFEVLANRRTSSDPEVRTNLVAGLAKAAGGHGMVGGQVLDLWAENNSLDEAGTVRMQRLKTGEMIAFAGEAGAILARARPQQRQALRMFSHDLGLAFQITDDLLDAEGSAEEVGKATGKDAAAGKATIVAKLGIEAARDQAALLSRQAASHLDRFGNKANPLRALCEFVITRSS